jgi:hypothetical protein
MDGLAVLVDLLGHVPLDFVALMSSINSVIGAAGNCDYTAANAVLDAFVDSADRPAPWQRVVAVNWGPWREVGMAANRAVPDALRAEHEAQLRAAISPGAGVQTFARILASGRNRVVVTTFDLDQALALSSRKGWRSANRSPRTAAAAADDLIRAARSRDRAGSCGDLDGAHRRCGYWFTG